GSKSVVPIHEGLVISVAAVATPVIWADIGEIRASVRQLAFSRAIIAERGGYHPVGRRQVWAVALLVEDRGTGQISDIHGLCVGDQRYSNARVLVPVRTEQLPHGIARRCLEVPDLLTAHRAGDVEYHRHLDAPVRIERSRFRRDL